MIAIKDVHGHLVWYHPDAIRELRVLGPDKTEVLIVHQLPPETLPRIAKDVQVVTTERKAMDIARDISGTPNEAPRQDEETIGL